MGIQFDAKKRTFIKRIIMSFTLSCSTVRVNATTARTGLKAKPTRGASIALKSAKTDEIIESMKTLTLMEASELVAQIEETFGVDASAPAGGGMVMAAGPGAAGDAGAEAKTEFDLVITEVGLKEAKDAVTNLPFTLMEGKKKEDCEAAQKTFDEAYREFEEKVTSEEKGFGRFRLTPRSALDDS